MAHAISGCVERTVEDELHKFKLADLYFIHIYIFEWQFLVFLV